MQLRGLGVNEKDQQCGWREEVESDWDFYNERLK